MGLFLVLPAICSVELGGTQRPRAESGACTGSGWRHRPSRAFPFKKVPPSLPPPITVNYPSQAQELDMQPKQSTFTSRWKRSKGQHPCPVLWLKSPDATILSFHAGFFYLLFTGKGQRGRKSWGIVSALLSTHHQDHSQSSGLLTIAPLCTWTETFLFH